MENGRNAALNGGRGSGQTVRRITELYENKIADIKANCDLAIEGRDIKIKELEEDVRNKKIAIKNRNAEIKLLGERCNQLLKDKGDLTDELAKWKEEWQEQVQKATDEGWERTKLTGRVRELEQQIEKMKNCGNCKYGYCGGSSISIDKDGNRTFHNWNEEKQTYCDIGKNGKYQCWEIKEND